MNKISKLLKDNSELIEQRLREYMPASDDRYRALSESMLYSLLAGGKRIRPFLTLEFCRLFGGKDEAALPLACAVEMIHTYSLIHDDLPEMDDDALRRGRPTNHKVYGHATALLAGDALLTMAFGVIAEAGLPASDAVAAVSILANNAGQCGMCGGQMLDLIGEKERFDFETLRLMDSLKTGKLIEASCLLGVIAAGHTDDSDARRRAQTYARGIGTAFQILDDILDVTSDSETTGKSLSDAQNDKTTFMTFMSVEDARQFASRLTDEAIDAVADIEGSGVLRDTALYLLDRKS